MLRVLPAALAASLAIAIALSVSTGTAGAQAEPGGALAVDCEGNTSTIDAACEFGEGQSFTISVHVTENPGEAYGGFQIKLRWDPAVVDYAPATTPAEEAVWADCTLPVRDDNRPEGDPSLGFGCLNFTADGSPPQLTTFTGVGTIFTFQCVGTGTSEVTLVPIAEDRLLGTTLINDIGINLESAVTNASVTCGGAAVPRPSADVSAGVTAISIDDITAEPTPPPATSPDDNGETANGNNGGEGDEDDDDGGIQSWVWVVIGFGVILLAAVVVGWTRVRSSP